MTIKVQFAALPATSLGTEKMGAFDLPAVPRVGDTVDLQGKMWQVAEVVWSPGGATAHASVYVTPKK
jgi:hypothetical protein